MRKNDLEPPGIIKESIGSWRALGLGRNRHTAAWIFWQYVDQYGILHAGIQVNKRFLDAGQRIWPLGLRADLVAHAIDEVFLDHLPSQVL